MTSCSHRSRRWAPLPPQVPPEVGWFPVHPTRRRHRRPLAPRRTHHTSDSVTDGSSARLRGWRPSATAGRAKALAYFLGGPEPDRHPGHSECLSPVQPSPTGQASAETGRERTHFSELGCERGPTQAHPRAPSRQQQTRDKDLMPRGARVVRAIRGLSMSRRGARRTEGYLAPMSDLGKHPKLPRRANHGGRQCEAAQRGEALAIN